MNNKKFFPSTILQSVSIFLMFIGFFILFLILSGFKVATANMFIVFILSYCCILLVLHSINKGRKSLVYNFNKFSPQVFLLAIIILLLIQVGVLSSFLLISKELKKGTLLSINTLTDITYIYKSLSLILMLPIFNEIVFRNFILRGLSFSYSENKAIIISGALYAITYFDFFNLNYVFLLGNIVFGCFIGWLFVKSQFNLRLVILLHILYAIIGYIIPDIINNFNNSGYIILISFSLLIIYLSFKNLKREIESLEPIL